MYKPSFALLFITVFQNIIVIIYIWIINNSGLLYSKQAASFLVDVVVGLEMALLYTRQVVVWYLRMLFASADCTVKSG